MPATTVSQSSHAKRPRADAAAAPGATAAASSDVARDQRPADPLPQQADEAAAVDVAAAAPEIDRHGARRTRGGARPRRRRRRGAPPAAASRRRRPARPRAGRGERPAPGPAAAGGSSRTTPANGHRLARSFAHRPPPKMRGEQERGGQASAGSRVMDGTAMPSLTRRMCRGGRARCRCLPWYLCGRSSWRRRPDRRGLGQREQQRLLVVADASSSANGAPAARAAPAAARRRRRPRPRSPACLWVQIPPSCISTNSRLLGAW